MASDTALTNGSFEETEYLRYAFNVPDVNSEQQRLRRCLATVEGELHALVSQCHGPLIDDLNSIEQADKSLQTVRSSIASLEQASQRLHQHIEAPCIDIEANVVRLKNLMKAVETSRNVSKFLNLVGKLKDTLQSDDLLRAARFLREAEEVLADSDLRGINVVEANLSVVTSAASTIRKEASEMLRKSLGQNVLSVSDCGKALQIFYSLESLPKKVSETLGEHKRNTMHLVLRELEVNTITTMSSSVSPAASSSATHHADPTVSSVGSSTSATTSAKDAVFFHIESALSGVRTYAQSVALLWKVAHRKRDPLSQQLFASALYPDHSRLLADFWETVSDQLATMLKLKGRSDLRNMLVSDYPRFHRLVLGFIESPGMTDFLRETQRNHNSTEAQLSALNVAEIAKNWLISVLSEAQSEYSHYTIAEIRKKCIPAKEKLIASSQSAASIPQNISMDPHRHSALPPQVTSIDLRAPLKWVTHEIAAHRKDPVVLSIVLQASVKALSEVLHTMEDKLKTKIPVPEVPSLTSSMTGIGLVHVAISNAAATVSADLAGSLTVLPAAIRSGVTSGGDHTPVIFTNLPDLTGLVRQVQSLTASFADLSGRMMQPYFTAASASLGQLVVSAVTDDGASGKTESLTRFEERLKHFVCHYALLFDRNTNVDAVKQQLALSLCKKFAVAICCIRPFTTTIQGHLIKNFLEFQAMLVPLASVERQKDSARLVQGMRTMLVSSCDDFLSGAKTEYLSKVTTSDANKASPQQQQQQQYTMHPLLVLLHCFQRVDPALLKGLDSSMEKPLSQFIMTGVALLEESSLSKCASIWEVAQQELVGLEERVKARHQERQGAEPQEEDPSVELSPKQAVDLVALCDFIGSKFVPTI